MEMTMQLTRTVKGREEIFNRGHTLRPRYRQLLFCIGDGISFGELCSKHPKCVELEAMVNEMLQNGFIQTLRNIATANAETANVENAINTPAEPAPIQADSSLIKAQRYVLEFMTRMAGTKSPAYRFMSEVRNISEFETALRMCYRVIAVSSPDQAAEMEAGATQRMGN
ncbi:MAG: hypothetical protein ACYCZA_02150 [Thiobacillus sp.]